MSIKKCCVNCDKLASCTVSYNVNTCDYFVPRQDVMLEYITNELHKIKKDIKQIYETITIVGKVRRYK